jgi:nicotinamide mononucleotide adenylyltransferase
MGSMHADKVRIPDDVVNYIYEHGLYRDLDQPTDDKGKGKADLPPAAASSSKG